MANQVETGWIGRIPVRNLWLLMLYASDLFKLSSRNSFVSVEDNPDELPDLVAEILAGEVELRIKRNLSSGYRKREDIVRRLRGRINLLYTERHHLLAQGKIACRFDELTVDTARNRFVRVALEEISKIARNEKLVHRCRSLAMSLKEMGVKGEKPGFNEGTIDRFARHDASDRKMVAAAHLVFDLALPTETTGSKYLPQPNRDIHWIRKLYEKGVAGFYKVALPSRGWRVEAGKTFYWHIDKKTSGIDKILPSMLADIILNQVGAKRRIVIDTKFNSILTKGWFREESLRSGYLFQIYAYLRSQEEDSDPLSRIASGLLLHPSVGEMINESVEIQGHEIRFATVDLSAESKEIRSQLLNIVGSPEA